jgi:hypothetical protein
MEHPKDIGDRSTLAIMLALRELGYAVYVPFGENTRCDLVIDDGLRLFRVQCKTGRLRNGADHLSARWQAMLRVEPARNCQQKRILHAQQYEIGRVDFAIAEPGARAGASGSCA